MTQPPPSAPSTPKPRRFPLASKRPPPPPPPPPPPQSQQQTPGGRNPVIASSQRFQATPRFAVPSSAQRQPSTPFFSSTQRRPRRRESILDALDSSPPDAPATATRATGTQRMSESIDIDSDVASDLEGNEDEEEEEEEKEEEESVVLRPTGLGVSDAIEVDESDASSDTRVGLDERTPKRRRISVSPPGWHDVVGDGIAESSLRAEEKVEEEEDDLPIRDMSEDEEMLPDANHDVPSGAGESEIDNDDDGVVDFPDPNVGIPVKSQPAFHQAPRFKMSETEPSPQEGLPEAFSPQRRGPKYLAGGLAAELQSWLAAAKGWGAGGGDRPADLVMRIEVDELRSGNRMYLVRGRRIVEEGGAREELAVRLMLAGEGRLTGLGQKAPVVVGSLVAVSQPAWDVVLEGVTWTVACDWVVVDS